MSLKLPRIPQGVPLVLLSSGAGTTTLILWWDQTATTVEQQEATQDGILDELAEQLAFITAVDEKADLALAGGGEMSPSQSLQLSQPLGITISSSDVGGSAGATIDITGHTRRYGNGLSVTVDPYFSSPDPYDTSTFIYYDDPGRIGGAVTYQFTTVEEDAYSSPAFPDRHYVGSLTLASDGGPPSLGVPGSRS